MGSMKNRVELGNMRVLGDTPFSIFPAMHLEDSILLSHRQEEGRGHLERHSRAFLGKEVSN